MGASPKWKVYRGTEYVASCKYIEDAAAICAMSGDGATIRNGHTVIVWREGIDGSAGDSYDAVVDHVYESRGE
jgi:hypothetical protein